MDHLEAIRVSAVEKYLLNELPLEMREEFEEHYFDCKECTTDLQATTVFMDAARQEFKLHPAQGAAPARASDIPVVIKSPFPQPLPKKKSVVSLFLQKPAIVWALAASLLVITYQNVFVYPHLETQVAELRTPELLSTLSLAGSNSRGGTIPALTVKADHPYLIAADIPAEDRFVSYTLELQAPSGGVVWRIPVTAELAKDLVTIHAPALSGSSGRYTLVIRGNTSAVSGRNPGPAGIELARDAFDMNLLK